MTRRRWVAGAAAVGIALFAGACGSDEEEASSGASSGGKSEIVFGTVGSFSSPQGGTIAGGRDVMTAWAKMVNDVGGIDGRPVRVVIKDDGGDPAKALNLVKQMVTQDKVVAVVGQSSFVEPVWAKYVSSQGVPVVGGSPYAASYVTDPNFFGIGANVAAQHYALVAEAKKFGNRFANLYCAEAPICAVGNAYIEEFAPALGVELPVMQKVSASQPNYTAVCKAIKDSRVQSYTVAHASPIAIKIAETCIDQGSKAENVAVGGEADAAWLPRPKLDGTINVENTAPYFDDSTAGTKGYRDFVAKYLPGFGPKDGAGPQFAYVSAELFEAAVKAAPGDEVTSDTVKQGLYALEDETLGGLTSPLNYTEGKPTQVNCWFTSQIKDGRWAAPNGAKYECAPDDAIGAAVTKIAGQGA